MKVERSETVLKPVLPSAAIRSWYRVRLRRLIREMARSMLLHIRSAYREHDPQIGFASDESPVLALERAMKKWGTRWVEKLDTASVDIAKAFATMSRKDFDMRFARELRRAGFTVKFQASRGMTEAYRAVIHENVNLIKSIPQQFLKDVQTSVWQAVMKGGDMNELSRSIKHNYGVSWRRASFIAEDQCAKARALMENVRRQEIGVTEAIWRHSGAGKVPRPTHVAMSGKRFELAKGMYDSAVQKFVIPGELPRCRCTSSPVIP